MHVRRNSCLRCRLFRIVHVRRVTFRKPVCRRKG
jgi:hypothetical protein